MFNKSKTTNKLTAVRIVFGCIFALLFVLTELCCRDNANALKLAKISFIDSNVLQAITIFEAAAALVCFLPQKKQADAVRQAKSDKKSAKRTLISALFILVAIPLTIYGGKVFFGDRKYYFISLVVILETIIPFCMVFEKRKPQARELAVVSVLCAAAAGGRAAFYMLPQFKPVIALVIVAGVCFGGETGFLVGAVTAFVSNFFFGQGMWTPWQMLAFGMTGFIAGICFDKGFLRKTKVTLSIFGFIATIVIYGGIMNPASVIMWQNNITKEMIISSYIMGIPFDAVHAMSTAFFLWFLYEPMAEKLERIKVKYGLI